MPNNLTAAGDYGAADAALARVLAGEYLNQIAGGISLNQQEVVRPHELGLSEAALAGLRGLSLFRPAIRNETRAAVAQALKAQGGSRYSWHLWP